MKKFYFTLWLFWAFRVIVESIVLAVVLSLIITTVLYIKQGFVPLEQEVLNALFELFNFWFLITLNFAVLIALFRSVKYIFNRCFAGFTFKLLSCPNKKEYIDVIGYGDLVKFWRKWFMLLIWLTAAFMIINLILFDYYNIYVLYGAILLSGYFSFIFIGVRCKQIRIVKC
ncbi:hypothetical protein [Sulfurimonas sp. C5]|uniref:hypothetical protein n=1 Tax=Sulfurimonas sp. C5 TaxID=3036947 RepID=UPI002458E247|nr:hypothetical protein [Sulfurimonas sp. C5]MDH4945280.1 hypothetical protein [Sulfurimonas sp. C5]